MENTKKTVATLTAEIVTDFEFEEPRSFNRRRGDLYTNDFEAEVGVKVGNKVATLTLRITRDYVGSTGEYGTPTYVASHYTPYGPSISNNKFESLEEAGIEIDFSEVLSTYQAEVWKAKDKQKKHKAEAKAALKAQRKAEYSETWPFGFINRIEKDPNKKIKFADFTLTPMGKGVYIHQGDTFLRVTYRGLIGTITRESDRYVWTDARRVNDPKDSYVSPIRVSNGKTRKAKRAGTILLKFLEAVDEYIVIKEARKTRAQKEADKREAKRLELEKAAGYPVVLTSETKYNHDRYSRRNGTETYQEYKNWIVTEQPDSRYGSHKGYRIGVDYDKNFSINGLHNLSKEKFTAILAILMEGKRAFSDIVFPKDKD